MIPKTLQKKRKVFHYPRLDTILNVEHLIKRATHPLSKNEIDRRLKKKMMRPTLNLILKYLEHSGKIFFSDKGIIWIYKDDITPALRERLKRGVKVA